MLISRTLARTALCGASFLALSTAALANPAVGLMGDRTLVMFDTETLEVSGMLEVEGVSVLHGIDVRASDMMLYGIDSDDNVVSIDTETGAATVVHTLSESIPEGAMASVDFNPVADALRFMGSDGTNLRINMTSGEVMVDGSLHFEDADANADATPNVVATAYTNSVGSPEETAMYDIDMDLGALLRQTAPNDGTLATIGELGIDPLTSVAFEIFAAEIGDNTAYLAVGKVLYTVDLETGATTEWGAIEGLDGDLRDLTVMHGGM